MSLLTQPRRRSQAGRAALIVLALLILVVLGAAGWYLMRGKLGAQAGMTDAAAKMAPANTQVFLAFDLDHAGIKQDQQVQIIGTLLKSKEVQAFNEELKREMGLSLEQDFLTWVTASGALIMAPADGQQSIAQGLQEAKGDVPPFRMLFVLKVRDEKAALASLEKVQTKASEESGTKYKTEDVNGATLHLPEKAGEAPAWTIHKGNLFIGFTADDLKLGVAPAGGQSLADAPGYKDALSKVKHHDGVVGYVDLQGITKGLPMSEIGSPDTEKLLGAMKFAVLGAGVDGNQTVSEWLLAVDQASAGPLGPKVFTPNHNIALTSAELYPKDADFYAALNLRMIWDIAYEVMGAFPEGKAMRDQPAQFLGSQGIDFQKDILGMLTGELSYSAKNMGKIQAMQIEQISTGNEPDPQVAMASFQQVPLMFTLGLKDKAALDRLLGKDPRIGMMMGALPASEFEGVTIRSNPPDAGAPEQFAFAITDKELIIAVTSAKKSIEAAVTARKSNENLKSLPGHAKILSMAGTDNKALGLLFQDIGRVYADAAKELKAGGKASPEIIQVVEQMGQLYGHSWSVVAMRADGLYSVSTVDLNKK